MKKSANSLSSKRCWQKHSQGGNLIAVQIQITDGFITDAQTINDLQLPEILLVDQSPFFVVCLCQIPQCQFLLTRFVYQLIPLVDQPFAFLRCITQEYIKNIACRLTVYEVSVILQPQYIAAFLNDTVFYIVEIVAALLYLLFDAFFRPLHCFKRYQPRLYTRKVVCRT